jgi:hypothetical protein
MRRRIDDEVLPSLGEAALLDRKSFWVTELGYDSCRGEGDQSNQLWTSHVDMFNRLGIWKATLTRTLFDPEGQWCGRGLAHAPDYWRDPYGAKPAYARYQHMTGVH